jgi:acetyl esterase/lipase
MVIGVLALVLSLAAAACGPTGRYIDEVFPSVDVTRDLQYGAAPDEYGVTERLLLDLYEPSGDDHARRPAIVWVHGGSFSGGDRSQEAVNATSFAKRGYVTTSIDYRLRSGNLGQAITDAQHDAQAAVRWLRRHADQYRIDPERIAIGGTSAGAITALYVGNHAEDPGTSGNPEFRSDVQAAVAVSGFGGWYSPGDAPAVLFHGTSDTVLNVSLAESTCRDHRAAGNRCDLHLYEGGGHNLYGENRGPDIRTKAAQFLYQTLRLPG